MVFRPAYRSTPRDRETSRCGASRYTQRHQDKQSRQTHFLPQSRITAVWWTDVNQKDEALSLVTPRSVRFLRRWTEQVRRDHDNGVAAQGGCRVEAGGVCSPLDLDPAPCWRGADPTDRWSLTGSLGTKRDAKAELSQRELACQALLSGSGRRSGGQRPLIYLALTRCCLGPTRLRPGDKPGFRREAGSGT